MKEVVTF